MTYQVVILQTGEDPRAAQREAELRRATEGTWLDPDVIACCPELPQDLSSPVVAVYLEPGQASGTARSTTATMVRAAEEALAENITVLPVLGSEGVATPVPPTLRRLQAIRRGATW